MHANAGPMYSVPLTTTSLTTGGGWDVLQVTANSSARFEVVEVSLGLASSAFPVQAGLALQVLRGSTATSAGSAILARNVVGHTGASTAALTVTGPSSALTSTSSAVLLWSGAFDADGRLCYRPKSRDERITVTLGQRLNLRVGTPSVAVTITGSMLLSETGKGLPS